LTKTLDFRPYTDKGQTRPLVREGALIGQDGINMSLLEIELGGVDWIGLAQDRDRLRAFVKAVMNLWIP
jgi:hypothetical protein